MNTQDATRSMRAMTSGECKWIGCESVHVYAAGSQVDGRYSARALVFKVVTAGRPYAGQAWMGCDEAAALVAAMTEQADSLRVQAGECGESFQLEGSDMAKKTSKKTVSKADAKAIVKVVKGEKAKAASKARVAAKLTDAAAAAGLVRVKRPSIVVKEIVKREGLRNTSHQYEIEAVVDHKGRNSWFVKLQGFFVAEFDGIAAAKKVYPNARILGGQGCAESVEGRPQAEAYEKETEQLKAAGRKTLDDLKALPKPKAVKAEESPEDRMARLKAAARKAWETRKANGWKHPKAKSEMLQKIDAQLAESRAISKQAREEFKAREEKKAEKRKALAVVKRVEKREADKRKGQPISRTPAVRLPQLEAILGQAFTK